MLTLAMAMCLTASYAQKNGDNNQKKSDKTTTITKQNLPQNSQGALNDNFPSKRVKSVKRSSDSD